MSADVLVISNYNINDEGETEAGGDPFLPAFPLTSGDSCTDDESMSFSVFGICAQVAYLRIMMVSSMYFNHGYGHLMDHNLCKEE
jgi:hypothetical protein